MNRIIFTSLQEVQKIKDAALLGRRNRWEKVSDIQCLYPVHGETIKLSPAMRGNLGAL